MDSKKKTAHASASMRRADQYDDKRFNYRQYWTARQYEHEAEEMALRRLLAGKRFKHAVDIGGGYGRLCPLLREYADIVTLAEPSQKQLKMSEEYLRDYTAIERKKMQADALDFTDGSVDLITMVRVMHHLPDPSRELAEIARVLTNDGKAIIEVANFAHARNRLRYIVKGKSLPVDPVDIRSPQNRRDDEIPFVNHNPETVIKQMGIAGLKVERVLSVSNLRSPLLKKILPRPLMLAVEKIMQPAMAGAFFGPSIFFLVKKS